MAFEYGFFWDSNNGDRKYNAACFEHWLKKFFRTGVFNGDLRVLADSSMNVTVSPGYCNVNGKVKFFEYDTVLQIETAEEAQDRIDSVVIERNDIERNIFLKIVKGEGAKKPEAKNLVRSDGIYQLAIAQIYVKAGAVKITQVDIKDTRTSLQLCGLVTGTVSQMDFSQLKAQFDAFYEECEDGFAEWFDEMKNQLTMDAAGNLQRQIEVERERINNLAKMEEGSTTGDAELRDARVGADGITYPTAGEAVRRQIENVQIKFAANEKKYEFCPVKLSDIKYVDTSLRVKTGALPTSKLQFDDAFSLYSQPGHCAYTSEVKAGDSIVLSNAHDLNSETPYLFVFDNNYRWINAVSFDELKDPERYDMKYTFGQDGAFFICFEYTTVQAGEFFYIKRKGMTEPLVLDAKKEELYENDSLIGEEVLDAIMNARQILVRVPNADGGDNTAIYSPIYMYQLPNRMNDYLYLFYLKDEKQEIDLTALGMGKIEMPIYGQIKLKLARDYNQTPLM